MEEHKKDPPSREEPGSQEVSLWCASVFIDGPLAFKLVESFGVLARSSRRLNRQVE